MSVCLLGRSRRDAAERGQDSRHRSESGAQDGEQGAKAACAGSVGRKERSTHISTKNGFFPRGGSASCEESGSLGPASFSLRVSRVGIMSNEVA